MWMDLRSHYWRIATKTRSQSRGYFYETHYFDRVTLFGLRQHAKHEQREILAETISEGSEELHDISPVEIYNSFVSMEGSSQKRKWYHRLWSALPLVKPAWDLSIMTFRNDCTCCCRKDSKFMKESRCARTWIVVVKVIAVVANFLALYVTIVAVRATQQIKLTKTKLPYVQEKLYNHINEGHVCAFNEKCGDVRTFDDEVLAARSNYTIVHCGACGHCSNWNDLELQWTTRYSVADQSQQCATENMFGSVDELTSCLARDIGFTLPCAHCWAEDIMCTKRFCTFIYLQSLMTNQLSNFEAGPDTITSATCEEANCEAGNPGDFVRW